MQFNSILVLLLFMITFIQTLHGQTCDCRFCSNTATVNPFSALQISNSVPCPAGRAAAVSTINVQSTNGLGFQIRTKDDPSNPEYYVAGSTTSTVTCFDMGSGRLVGGRQSRIYIVISCESVSQPCQLRFSISINCILVATTTTTTSTLASNATSMTASTAKSTTTSTATSTTASNLFYILLSPLFIYSYIYLT